ncbi:ribbon-helix-helix protein, CopG family [Luteolibacter arcticus]|uniref:ribbon-helix-helix protein, CopG family n=1 Tax=Luteolibacter arcticus TaxID=1581411 RepID=UPI0034E0C922
MNRTLTIRIPDDLALWLKELASRTGVSRAQFIREQLEKARANAGSKPFMRLAGVLGDDSGLSRRNGFSRPVS